MTGLRVVFGTISSLFGMLLASPIILLGLPFWAVAFLTRVVCRLLEPPFLPWNQLIEFEPTFGWKPKSNLNAYGFANGAFHVTTDPQGWPGNRSIAESQVVVFGDSFAFGYGVNAKALFSELNPKLPIKPIGAPGYNMVQELLWMRQLSPQLKGKLVVWFIYINDLYENLQPNMQNYRTPFVRQVNGVGSWEIVNDHISPIKWPYRFVDKVRSAERVAGVYGKTFFSQRIYSACEFLISKGKDICTSGGARLVVMTIPAKPQLNGTAWAGRSFSNDGSQSLNPDTPDQRISEICSKLGVPFVAAKSHLTMCHYLRDDEHWNEKGHRRIAAVLWRLYQDHLLEIAVVIGSQASNDWHVRSSRWVDRLYTGQLK